MCGCLLFYAVKIDQLSDTVNQLSTMGKRTQNCHGSDKVLLLSHLGLQPLDCTILSFGGFQSCGCRPLATNIYTNIRLYQIHVTTLILVCIQFSGPTFVLLISELTSLAVANHPLATRLTPTPTYLYLCELRVHCGRTQNQFLYRSYQALELTCCLTEESRIFSIKRMTVQ